MGELNAPFTSTLLSRIGTRILLHPAPAVCAPLTRGSPPECSQKKKKKAVGGRGCLQFVFLPPAKKKTLQATPFPPLTFQGLESCVIFYQVG